MENKEKKLLIAGGSEHFRLQEDVMKGLFGYTWKSGAYQKAFYPLSGCNKIAVWFPKLAVMKTGELVSQSINQDWVNTLSEDWNTIRMYSETFFDNPSSYDQKLADRLAYTHITFFKPSPKEDYCFAGIYAVEKKNRQLTDITFKRITPVLDMSQGYKGLNDIVNNLLAKK